MMYMTFLHFIIFPQLLSIYLLSKSFIFRFIPTKFYQNKLYAKHTHLSKHISNNKNKMHKHLQL